MQYKKDEIKKRILEAAISEFGKVGYTKASILGIAQLAHVPIGNFYRYFKNKEALFDAIVEDVCRDFPALLQNEFEYDIALDRNVRESTTILANGIIKIFEQYGSLLLILVDKSEGTKHEDFGSILIEKVTELVEIALYNGDPKKPSLMSKVIAQGFIHGLFTIFREVDSKSIHSEVEKFMLYYFYKVEERTR